MNIAQVHQKVIEGVPFKFAQVSGTGDADHASWWSFDDEQSVRDRWWYPKKGETVLEIGAAFGSYVLPALARGARVIAFSPADFDTELLNINLKLNPDLAKRCLVVRDGLYSCNGYFDPDHCKFSPNKVEGKQWLPVRSLDSFLSERPGVERIAWMKLDVEGAELEVLKGAELTIRDSKPKILVENHEFHDPQMATKVRDYLVGLGLGYVCDGPIQHCAVSHSFFEVRQ